MLFIPYSNNCCASVRARIIPLKINPDCAVEDPKPQMDTSYAETGSYLYVRIFSTAEKDIEKKIVWQIITTHQSAGKK